MSVDFLSLVERRFSVRSYKDDPIPESVITKILDSARKAPTAGNLQPWKFIVVFNNEIKGELAEAALGQEFVASAPVSIVVCAEPERSGRIYGDRGRNLYCIQDTAAAVQNILLAAASFQVGSCWVGAFDETAVSKCLDLSPDFRPVAIITLGYTDDEGEQPRKRSLEDIVEIIK